MWGGALVSSIDYTVTLLQALVDFAENSFQDPDAAAYVAFAWVPSYGIFVANSELTYAKPVANPPILQSFTAVPNISSTLRFSNITDLARELNQRNPDGLRETYWTITFKNDLATVQASLDIFVEEVEALKNITGTLPASVIQAIPKDMIRYYSKNGGNRLGIDGADGPLILINIAIMWTDGDASADAAVLAAAGRMIDRTRKVSIAKGTDYRYLYQNYAFASQDVFGSYAHANLARLKEISRKYDREQVSQRLQPGYFKLGA